MEGCVLWCVVVVDGKGAVYCVVVVDCEGSCECVVVVDGGGGRGSVWWWCIVGSRRAV